MCNEKQTKLFTFQANISVAIMVYPMVTIPKNKHLGDNSPTCEDRLFVPSVQLISDKNSIQYKMLFFILNDANISCSVTSMA